MRAPTTALSAMTAVALLAVLAGCSDSNEAPSNQSGTTEPGNALSDKLVGRWEGKVKPEIEANGVEVVTPDMGEFPVSFEFRKDGTMSMVMPPFDQPIPGTWKTLRTEGDKLTIHTVMEMPSFSFELSTEQGDEGAKTTERTEMKSEKQPQDLTIDFQTDDRIVVTAADDPQPITLERKSGS